MEQPKPVVFCGPSGVGSEFSSFAMYVLAPCGIYSVVACRNSYCLCCSAAVGGPVVYL